MLRGGGQVFQGIARDLIPGGRPRLFNEQAVYKKPAPARDFPCAHPEPRPCVLDFLAAVLWTVWVALRALSETRLGF